ncbi:MAG: undecaprenyl-diphosphate phosphatase [Candidatus Ancaeobacter aquaticus]|nr:undecaprenyl-diphosphate phosphatase [Candidatus Ancaeobacter aquaticus]
MWEKILYNVILGVVQGVTEFLPVSSSGHLVITHNLFGFEEPQLFVDIVLHVGTLIAVLLFLWKDVCDITIGFIKGAVDILRGNKNVYKESSTFRMGIYIIIATIPTGIMGILLKDWFESLFGSIGMVGFFLLITGGILFFTKYYLHREKKEINIIDVILLGIVQGCAICPGISRSGITISTGIYRGIDPVKAAKFSFLISIPAIIGATLVQCKDVVSFSSTDIGYVLIGFFVSIIAGYCSLVLLLKLVRAYKLYYFSFYCWSVGLIIIIYMLMKQ